MSFWCCVHGVTGAHTDTDQISPIIAIDPLSFENKFKLSILTLNSAQQRATLTLVWHKRGCREGWVCFYYWLNALAARAPALPAATRISCCRHVHSHTGVDILTQGWIFLRRGGYSHTGVDTIAHRDILLKIDFLSHSSILDRVEIFRLFLHSLFQRERDWI